jgi:hypothetical protein
MTLLLIARLFGLWFTLIQNIFSELMCVMYVYGHARFSDDIEEMAGR